MEKLKSVFSSAWRRAENMGKKVIRSFHKKENRFEEETELKEMPRRSSPFLRLVVIFGIATALLIFAFLPATSNTFHVILGIAAFLVGAMDSAAEFIYGFAEGTVSRKNVIRFICALILICFGKFGGGTYLLLTFRGCDLVLTLSQSRRQKAMSLSIDQRPEKSHLMIGGIKHAVDSSRIAQGDILLLEHGDIAAVDCVVCGGTGTVNSWIEGFDAKSIHVEEGSIICSGMKNAGDALTVKAIRSAEDSSMPIYMNKVLSCVESVPEHDLLTGTLRKVYPVIFQCAGIFFGLLLPLIFSREFSVWVPRGIALLALSSPEMICTLIRFTYICGLFGAAKKGVLVNRPETIEEAASVATFAVDEGGALASDKFTLGDVTSGDNRQEDVMRVAVSVCRLSKAPRLRCIAENADTEQGIVIVQSAELPGKGIAARTAEGTVLCVGTKEFLESMKVSNAFETIDNGIYISENRVCIGVIRVDCPMRADAEHLSSKLREYGVNRLVLFSEKKRKDAYDVARALGIGEFYPELTRSAMVQKMSELKSMQLSTERIAFIGDGSSDADVMSQADIGFVMIRQNELQEQLPSDVVLMTDSLSSSGMVVALSRDIGMYARLNRLISVFGTAVFGLAALFGVFPAYAVYFAEACMILILQLNALRGYDSQKYDPEKLRMSIHAAGQKWKKSL